MNKPHQPEYANNGLTLNHMPEEFEGEFVIPEGVKEIADNAFYGCTNLTAVEFPITLEKIGAAAFSSCERLESIDIPDSVMKIGESAFLRCYSLSKVRLSANLRVIEDNTFRATAIEEIDIPDSVQAIGYQAFGNCDNLLDVRMPNDIYIDDSAFENCYGLLAADAVYLNLYGNPHYKLVKVFPHAFHYSIPDDVIEIGNEVIKDCDNIESLVIPDSVKIIHSEAFSGSKIKMIKIGNGLTELPDNCFSNCELLEEVDIPDSVSSIGEFCFSNCKNLQSIKLSNSIENILKETFSGCSRLTKISLPQSMSSIGERAFYGCSGLTSINIPSCVTSIGDSAFSGCSRLTKISLPQSMSSIGERAFYGCSMLKVVDYSGNVSIGIDSFRGTLVKDNYLLPDFKYYGKMLPSQWESDTPPGNTMLKVYRGIPMENADIAEQLIKDIKENGLYLEQITEKFKNEYHHKEWRGHNKLTKEELDNLYSNNSSIEIALEGQDQNQVYFGDYICALNYAKHGSFPIIIEAEMPLNELNIDGVDSFKDIFNPYSDNITMRETFSRKIEMYYEKYRTEAINIDGEDLRKFRAAIVNMAESDNDIVYAFYKNNRVISGRCGNIFKYAFQAKLPIKPERIMSVKVLTKESCCRSVPDISLQDFR